ncbi:hypothetical protein FGB62_24g132 [Gracilaria domingensis]|nr:hypothetical protein FGB62_24g132 [Gracilaria domingensis]
MRTPFATHASPTPRRDEAIEAHRGLFATLLGNEQGNNIETSPPHAQMISSAAVAPTPPALHPPNIHPQRSAGNLKHDATRSAERASVERGRQTGNAPPSRRRSRAASPPAAARRAHARAAAGAHVSKAAARQRAAQTCARARPRARRRARRRGGVAAPCTRAARRRARSGRPG